MATAIMLVQTDEPTEAVCLAQPRVHVKWESQVCGFGTLFITERNVVWITDTSENGFTLSYPSIGVYGITATDSENPDPGLFMVVDMSKTNIARAEQSNGVAKAGAAEENGTHEHGDDDDDEGASSATVRFTPEDPNSLNLITGLMQRCNLLNPDADDEHEMADPDYSFASHEANEAGDATGEAPDSWFTPETPDNEIRLSAEGRSNLERIVGNLNLSRDENNAEADDKEGDDQMDL